MSVINAMIATCLRDDEGSHLTLTKDPPQIFAKACKGGDEEIKSHLYNMSHTRVNDRVKLRFQGDGTYIGKVMYSCQSCTHDLGANSFGAIPPALFSPHTSQC